jgi:coronin-7
MDKIHLLEFHPTSKNILLTTSDDLGKPTIRIWNLDTKKDEITLTGIHKDVIFSCAWSPDGTQIATTTKEKKIRVLDARTGDVISEGPSHNSLRSSRLLWLNQNTELLVSVGFGIGSAREVLLFSKKDLSKPVAKLVIDYSPGVMSAYFDKDCLILYVAGRGDRTIHTFHVELDTNKLVALAKIEAGSLQQGFSFLPKRECNVKDIEIAKFYRLTPNNIEVVGVRVPRARVSMRILDNP